MTPTGSRRAVRKDGNDKEQAAFARSLGWALIHQPPGAGCDWVALLPDGRVLIVEIKDPTKPPSARKLTGKELELFEQCALRGVKYHIFETKEQILRVHKETTCHA